MSIQSQAELKKLQAIGKIVGLTLEEMRAAVRPGITTSELDRIGATVLAKIPHHVSPALLRQCDRAPTS